VFGFWFAKAKELKTILSFVTIGMVISGEIAAHSQGAINFDTHNNWIGTDYTEAGMEFQLAVPQGPGIDYFGITSGSGNTPGDDTPYMQWFRQNNLFNYVSLSTTDNSLFGLTSIQLADPLAPSTGPVSISFVGYLAGGSAVTETFTTPGNGATSFQNYTFNSDFASGLTHVDIVSSKWAMDNLTFTVPEPSPAILTIFGLSFGFFYRKWRSRAQH
jgi:hypothetical protein